MLEEIQNLTQLSLFIWALCVEIPGFTRQLTQLKMVPKFVSMVSRSIFQKIVY